MEGKHTGAIVLALDKLLVADLKDLEAQEWREVTPEIDPPSKRDVDLAKGCMDMHLHMQDPCPVCGGFRMLLGDWVCWGVCHLCASVEDFS